MASCAHAKVQAVEASRAANEAIQTAGRRLSGTTRGPFRIDSVSWYGAVEIDPRNLVVWVLLSGAPDEQLPKWYFPVAGQLAGLQDHLDVSLRAWLDENREAVHEAFVDVAWPAPDTVRVGFDSTHRVESEGGYAYFK